MQELSKSPILIITILLSFSFEAHAVNLVCYYSNAAYNYTILDNSYTNPPSNIDATLCTHYVYAYAVLNKTTFEITSSDPENDVTNGGYLNFTRLRANNTQAKFLLALGGKLDSNDASGKYSLLVSNPSNINAFVNSTLAFLQKYNFDGLSFDWLVPNSPKDFMGYSNVITALKAAFTQKKLLLSSSVSALQKDIDGYDVPVLNKYLDLIYLTTFGYHTPDVVPNLARHPSPLYSPPNDPPAANLTADFSVRYWMAKGLYPGLINLGIPLHGYAWNMNTTINSPPYLAPAQANGGFKPEFSLVRVPGLMTNLDLCFYLQNYQMDVKLNVKKNISPYFAGTYGLFGLLNLWGGFDNDVAVVQKVNYALKNSLGGVMLMDISQDDFMKFCGNGDFSTTTLVSSMLSGSFYSNNKPTPPPAKCYWSCPQPDPSSCKSFNVLLDGVSYKTSCPARKYFNSASLKCDDDPTNTKCPSMELKKSEVLSYNAVKYDWKVAY